MKKKRQIIAAAILFFFMLLSGFAQEPVKLQNSSTTPLIDLDKAIQLAHWGAEEDSSSSSENSVSENKYSPSKDNPEDDPEEKTFLIEVKGKNIRVNGIEAEDTDALIRYLKDNCKNEDRLLLKDDYADSDTYKDMLKAISSFAQSQDIDYSGDYADDRN